MVLPWKTLGDRSKKELQKKGDNKFPFTERGVEFLLAGTH